MSNKIISPCISICKTDPVTGYCYGFARTEEEKRIWKDENTNKEWKSKNLEALTKRMEGWQLNAFQQSYNHKINNGILGPILFQEIEFKKVEINKGVDIGASSVILPGTIIGEYTQIGAMSLVNKSLGKCKIAVGNPCREINDIKFINNE